MKYQETFECIYYTNCSFLGERFPHGYHHRRRRWSHRRRHHHHHRPPASSEIVGLRKHEKTQHALVGLGSAALAAAVVLPR